MHSSFLCYPKLGVKVMLKFLRKVFEPNKVVGFLFFNLGMLLLIYVFARHLEDTFLAYLAYFLSTYALIIMM